MCVTVASYDDLECEVSHVLYFMTTDYHGNTVEALLIIKLLRCSLQAKISLDFTPFFYKLRVTFKHRIALLLYIPLKNLYFSLKLNAAVCHPHTDRWSNKKVLCLKDVKK